MSYLLAWTNRSARLIFFFAILGIISWVIFNFPEVKSASFIIAILFVVNVIYIALTMGRR